MQGDILNLVSAPVVGAYIGESSILAGSQLLGYDLFPSKRIGGLDLSFIKGKFSQPVLASPVAYDAEIGVELKANTEKIYLKENLSFGGAWNKDYGQIINTSDTVKISCSMTSDAATRTSRNWKISLVSLGVSNASGADNLGNHTASQNFILGSNWLTGDGDPEGIKLDGNGNVFSLPS